MENKRKTLMWHRISAVRNLTGGRKTLNTQLSATEKSLVWVRQ